MKNLLVLLFMLFTLNVNAQSTTLKDSVRIEFTKLLKNYRLRHNIFIPLKNSTQYNQITDNHARYQNELQRVTHDKRDNSMLCSNTVVECCAAIYITSKTSPYDIAFELFETWRTSIDGHNYGLIAPGREYGLGMSLGDNKDGSFILYATYIICSN